MSPEYPDDIDNRFPPELTNRKLWIEEAEGDYQIFMVYREAAWFASLTIQPTHNDTHSTPPA